MKKYKVPKIANSAAEGVHQVYKNKKMRMIKKKKINMQICTNLARSRLLLKLMMINVFMIVT